MQHSTWDLEVHARDLQQRRLREADRARLIEAARQLGDQMGVAPIRFSVSRFITAFRDRLSPQRSSTDGAVAPAVVETHVRSIPVPEPRPSPDTRSGTLSQPYAGMVILARGRGAQPTAQPCAAGDY